MGNEGSPELWPLENRGTDLSGVGELRACWPFPLGPLLFRGSFSLLSGRVDWICMVGLQLCLWEPEQISCLRLTLKPGFCNDANQGSSPILDRRRRYREHLILHTWQAGKGVKGRGGEQHGNQIDEELQE